MAVRSDREAGAEVARALQAVEDPELPVSIVDLGMVRAVTVSAGAAVVELVPTFLACPGPVAGRIRSPGAGHRRAGRDPVPGDLAAGWLVRCGRH